MAHFPVSMIDPLIKNAAIVLSKYIHKHSTVNILEAMAIHTNALRPVSRELLATYLHQN